jgi:hypothetical protein
MVRRDFGQEPMIEDEILNCHWYAVIDNTIGGWSISNVDQSVADLNPYEGRFELGSFLTESEAKHIAKLHNDWWDIQVWGTYMTNIAWSFNQPDTKSNLDKWWHRD